ncbi:MAG: hypothetical protein AAFR93_09360, partial [Pseudomonadota bacterium]
MIRKPDQTADAGGTNVGRDNSGTIIHGLSPEQAEIMWQNREAALRGDLERAHGAENALSQAQRALAQAELDAVTAKLADFEAAYVELQKVVADLRQQAGNASSDELQAANDALSGGDIEMARAIYRGIVDRAEM